MIEVTTSYQCRACGSENIVRNGTNKVGSALLVKLWRFFECFPLLLVMTENHQPDMLPFDQIKQFNRTGADRFGVRVATVILLVTGKALAEGYSINRQ